MTAVDSAPEFKMSEKKVSVDHLKLPSSAQLERAADCLVTTADGEKIPFKSLYSVGPGQRRTLVLFIRHFFCGNCQEFVRSLRSQIPPTSLPSDLSIAIIGCGSHTLIPSYIIETDCPYPIYSDHEKKIYDALGMHRTLSLGWKGPDYIQHTLVTGMMKSIVQSVKRFPAGDALSGGDMRVNGGEFLFSAEGRDPSEGPETTTKSKGNSDLKSISVLWCHRMMNSRNHSEVEQIRTVLGLYDEKSTPPRRRPEKRWTSDNFRRSLSNRRQSWLDRTNSASKTSSVRQDSRQSSRRRQSPANMEGNDPAATIREEIRRRDGAGESEGVKT